MKLALILPAVIGMLDSEMSALGQIPGFPDGRPLQMPPTSRTPSRPSPTPSKPIPIPGFPDGRPLQMSPTSPTPSRPSPTPANQSATIDWQHWQSVENYRYRIGSRLAGKWERDLELELTAPLVSLRFTEIHYGEARAEDVTLFPDNRSIQIKLVYRPLAKWNWKVTAYPVTRSTHPQ